MARHARVTPLLGGALLGGALLGSALAAGAVVPGGVALADTTGTTAPKSRPVACDALDEALDDAVAALKQAKTAQQTANVEWSKKRSALSVAEAELAAEPKDEALTLARDRAHAAAGRAQSAYFLADNRLRNAQADYSDAVRLADQARCDAPSTGQQPPNPKPSTPKHPSGGDSRGPDQGGRPHPPTRAPHPAPAVAAGSSSSSQSTAVAIAGPAPVLTVETAGAGDSDGGWARLGGWVGDWFDGDDATGGSAGGDAAPVGSDSVVEGSLVPTGAVDAGDGSDSGLDVGHIGMAVAGLGALGLAGAGGAALGGRRARR